MSEDFPITFNFDGTRLVGFMHLTEFAKQLPNLHEYALVPSYRKNDDGSFTVDSYGLVHRSQVATEKSLERKYGKGNF